MIGKDKRRISITIPFWLDNELENLLDWIVKNGKPRTTKSKLLCAGAWKLLNTATNTENVEKEETK